MCDGWVRTSPVKLCSVSWRLCAQAVLETVHMQGMMPAQRGHKGVAGC